MTQHIMSSHLETYMSTKRAENNNATTKSYVWGKKRGGRGGFRSIVIKTD